MSKKRTEEDIKRFNDAAKKYNEKFKDINAVIDDEDEKFTARMEEEKKKCPYRIRVDSYVVSSDILTLTETIKPEDMIHIKTY